MRILYVNIYIFLYFQLNAPVAVPPEPVIEDNSLDSSSYDNSLNFPLSITNKVITHYFLYGTHNNH